MNHLTGIQFIYSSTLRPFVEGKEEIPAEADQAEEEEKPIAIFHIITSPYPSPEINRGRTYRVGYGDPLARMQGSSIYCSLLSHNISARFRRKQWLIVFR
jgi:hypothetical protein